jgi:hypothetical protein
MMNHFSDQLRSAVLLGLLGLLLTGFANAKVVETTPVPAPGDFSTTIDNGYLPLSPGGVFGATFAYRAETEDGCEYNKLTVTSEQYLVATGHTTLIIRDQEWEDEDCDGVDVVLVEDTKDYHAQDLVNGGVWYFGEETYALPDPDDCLLPPCDCDDGGSWEAGVVGEEGSPAEPGIIMLGDPKSGQRYRQELLEEEAEDWGAVLRLNAKVSIEYMDSEFEGCLMTKEWTPLEPGEIEHKFYCPGPGNPNPGLMFIAELKEKSVYVEYVGPDFSGLGIPLPLPGETDVVPLGTDPLPDPWGAFPSPALICDP